MSALLVPESVSEFEPLELVSEDALEGGAEERPAPRSLLNHPAQEEVNLVGCAIQALEPGNQLYWQTKRKKEKKSNGYTDVDISLSLSIVIICVYGAAQTRSKKRFPRKYWEYDKTENVCSYSSFLSFLFSVVKIRLKRN